MTTAMIDDLYARRIHTTLRNILSPRQDLKFAQLKIYYQERGLELNEQLDMMKIENVTHAKVTSSKRIEKNLVDPVAMREAIIIWQKK